MIDYLAIGVTHLLLALAMVRLLSRGDLDREPAAAPTAQSTPVDPAQPPPSSTPQGGVARLPGLRRPRGGPRA